MIRPITHYCEQLGAPLGLLQQPLNAITNLAFFAAAYAAYRLAVKGKVVRDWQVAWLVGWIATIGVGSTLFHTFATYPSMLADVIPIAIYQISYLAIYSRRVVRLKPVAVAGMIGLFLVMGWAVGELPASVMDPLNGSLAYAPAILFLSVLAVFHARSGQQQPLALGLAVGVFLLSLTARTLDFTWCAQLPIGLHFLWHLLNAVVLYLTMSALVRNLRQPKLKAAA